MNYTFKELQAQGRADAQQRRDKVLCWAGLAALLGFGIDLVARGPDSLYGRFFLWLVSLQA